MKLNQKSTASPEPPEEPDQTPRFSRRTMLAGALGGVSILGATENPAIAASDDVSKKSTPLSKAELFSLSSIKLLEGPVHDGQELNRRYLLKLDPDRLLSWFRREAGLASKAPPYRGWESEAPLLPGHILGFYMSGTSMMLQATGDAELRHRLEYIVDQLAEIQHVSGSGCLVAVPNGKKVFAEIASGRLEIDGAPWTGFSINGNFEPTYTLNKIMLGLYQILLATGNGKCRDVLIKLADWFGETVLDKLNDAQIQKLLDCEHGSLHESFADVYVLTGKEKHLTWARKLCHERMLAPLAAGNVDFLNDYHANAQIPKYTGFHRIYLLTGESKLNAAAVNFWEDVVSRRTWVIGGNSVDEHFFDPKKFNQALHAAAGPESCNTVNMLRLTETLYRTNPSAHFMDYYERALFNHLLSVHDPERGMFVYYTTMQPGGYRIYSDEFDSMWCCVGTGLEAPGKYGQMIYASSADDKSLYVNLFVASELTWKSKGVTVRQTTNFPDEPGTTLTLTCARLKASFALQIRHPWWVPANRMEIKVNGQPVANNSKPGEYAKIHREWSSGDKVQIALPMSLSVKPLPGDDHYVALLHGPIVLSGALGSEGMTREDFWGLGNTLGGKSPLPETEAPIFIAETAQEVGGRIKPVAGKSSVFRAEGLTGGNRGAELIPFYKNHFQRYAIHWPRLSAQEFRERQQRLAEERRRQRELDAKTLDRVEIGNPASEAAHHLQGERTQSGPGAYGEHMETRWRDARDGGWFSFDLKIMPEQPAILYCVYWGREGGARTFDVLANGQSIAATSLGDTGKAEFRNAVLTAPADLVKGKATINVKFQAHPGNTAGGLFDLRILKSAP